VDVLISHGTSQAYNIESINGILNILERNSTQFPTLIEKSVEVSIGLERKDREIAF
jgi:hypothetical protein